MSVGIKETKEAMIGINELAIYLAIRLKDGAQISDALDLIKQLTLNSEFKDVVKKAFDGIKQVPSEVKDLNLEEGLELAQLQLNYVPKYVEAFKK